MMSFRGWEVTGSGLHERTILRPGFRIAQKHFARSHGN